MLSLLLLSYCSFAADKGEQVVTQIDPDASPSREFTNTDNLQISKSSSYMVVLDRDNVTGFDKAYPENSTTLALDQMTALQTDYKVQSDASTTLVLWSFTAQLTASQVADLQADSRVSVVAPNNRVILAEPTGAPLGTTGPSPLWQDITVGNQTESWGTQAMNPGGAPLTSTKPVGNGARVYIVDYGVEAHSDLNVVQFANPSLCAETDEHCDLDASHIVPCYPHSTHVAGIIGAIDNDIGTVGVAAGVDLVSVGTAHEALPGACAVPESDYDFIRAFEWVYSDVRDRGEVGILSLSFNNLPADFLEALVNLATPTGDYPGTLVVQSAGNQFSDACEHAYAGTAPGYLVVGALDERGLPVEKLLDHNGFQNGVLAGSEPGSNYGSCVDLWAPGPNILSSWTAEGREPLSGTSMSAPHVAGLAALLAPDASTSTELEALVMARAYDLTSIDQDGFGLLMPTLGAQPPSTAILSRVGVRENANDVFATNTFLPQRPQFSLELGFDTVGLGAEDCEVYRVNLDTALAPEVLCMGASCREAIGTRDSDWQWPVGLWSVYSETCPAFDDVLVGVPALIDVDWTLDGAPFSGTSYEFGTTIPYGSDAVLSFDALNTESCDVSVEVRLGLLLHPYSAITMPTDVVTADVALPIYDPGTYQYNALCVDEYGTPLQGYSLMVEVAEPLTATVPVTGGWYDANRPGWAVDLQPVGGDQYVATWYTYRPDGTPVWYISDVADMVGNELSMPLLEVYWDGATATNSVVGSLDWTFSTDDTAVMTWNFTNGPSGVEQVTAFLFDPAPVGPANGLWYESTEPGWGLSVWHQGDTLVLTGALYDAAGLPTWVQGVAESTNESWVFDDLYQVVDGVNLCPECTGTSSSTVESGIGTALFTYGATSYFEIQSDFGTGITGGWDRTFHQIDRIAPQ